MYGGYVSKRIGLALSGGGIRAAVYHLGVLQFMAEAGLFEKIASISSVSGASMCMGAIFAANANKWPTAREFTERVQPAVRRLILSENIQRAALLRLPFSPHRWRHRVRLLADMLEKMWGISGTLQDLPPFPFWEINCTTFETGGRFRFRRDYMGDAKVGFVQNPILPVSHMIAASAAFPVLIGPYVLDTEKLDFNRCKFGKNKNVAKCDNLTLWDGGVYDNLGLDPLHKIGRGLDNEIDFIIVSNASAPISEKQRGRFSANLRRLLDISSSQVESLRVRDFSASVVHKKKGLYLKIGHSPLCEFCQNYPTTLNAPSEKDFEKLFNNGYESLKKCC